MGIIARAAQEIFGTAPYKVTRYIDIFDEDGKRITSLPVSKGKTADEVLAEAKEKYPDNTSMATSIEDHRLYVSGGYTYDASTGTPKAPPEPTAEELQAQALAALDSEYQAKFNDLDDQIVKAAALKNTALQDELIAERNTLAEEYAKKRGEL